MVESEGFSAGRTKAVSHQSNADLWSAVSQTSSLRGARTFQRQRLTNTLPTGGRRYSRPEVCVTILLWVLALNLLCGCSKSSAPAEDGKTVAASACTLCHTLPSPAQLPPEEWPYALAWMGGYLGFPADIPINTNLVVKGLIPPVKLFTRAQFDAIRKYYLEESARQFKRSDPLPTPPVSKLFEPEPIASMPPVISMVAIDPVDRALAIGTSLPAGLFLFQLQGGFSNNVSVPTEPIDFERIGSARRISLIGDLGHDARRGAIIDLNVNDLTRKTLIERQPRIASHRTADLDGDGNPDLIVCAFGDYPTGRLAIEWGPLDGQPARAGAEQVLSTEAGGVWCDVADMDGDGDLDIIFTMGNNRPRICAFVNQGGRRFVLRTIVDRPVGWGYNRCLLVDWDGDGRKDIVELAGNNLELRGRPLKPWHGIRVLHNDGDWKFHEVLFEPLPGAMDVVAGDFDGNGKVDLAVTAFCPDWRAAFPTTFLLLMQRVDGTVERSTIDNRFWNRWMRIGAGDVDGDGDIDLVLGAAEVPVGIPDEHASRYQEMLRGKSSVVILRNNTKR